MQYTCSYSSPLGEMLIASDGSAVTGLWFIGQKYFGKCPYGNAAGILQQQ